MTRLVLAYGALLLIGAAWGLSAPVVRFVTGQGFAPLAILFWQSLINMLVLGLVLAALGRLRNLPLDAAHLRLYAVVGLAGMVLPSWASYTATVHLPAGIVSIIISLVPLFALPMALALGTERFQPSRLTGVALGGTAMAMLIAPDASLPDPALWVWIPVAALAPPLYAVEGAYVYRTAARRADPLQTLAMGYVFGLIFAAPMVWVEGVTLWPQGVAWWVGGAFVVSGLCGILAYAGYLMLLRRTGPVFGAQVAYTVTGMGIVWSMTLLGERYSPWVWGALALLFAGLALVQPRGALQDIVQELNTGEGDARA
jgi:drug/metabolite transporter (DMT)-like permease